MPTHGREGSDFCCVLDLVWRDRGIYIPGGDISFKNLGLMCLWLTYGIVIL